VLAWQFCAVLSGRGYICSVASMSVESVCLISTFRFYRSWDLDFHRDRHGQIDLAIHPDQEYIFSMWSETLPSACYIRQFCRLLIYLQSYTFGYKPNPALSIHSLCRITIIFFSLFFKFSISFENICFLPVTCRVKG